MIPPGPFEDVAAAATASPTLQDAAGRLESALARLEALVEAGPLQSDLFRAKGETPAASQAASDDLHDALEAALAREQALEMAAAAASQALGRAMDEVRRALDEEPDSEAEEAPALDPASPTAEDVGA